MGAGVIPFSVVADQVCFLFQTTFSGRKQGHLIDFGGGCDADEHYTQAAMREFIEETETMYFATDIPHARKTERTVSRQMSIIQALFEKSLAENPDWWCQRLPGKKTPAKDWRTYFIEIPYRNVAELNLAWEKDAGERFTKRRKLLWITADHLLHIYQNTPLVLWKRVRELEDAESTIRQIIHYKLPCNV